MRLRACIVKTGKLLPGLLVASLRRSTLSTPFGLRRSTHAAILATLAMLAAALPATHGIARAGALGGPIVMPRPAGPTVARQARMRPAGNAACGIKTKVSSGLYVANDGDSNVLEFLSPYTAAPATINNVTYAVAVAFDDAKNMFVTDYDTNAVLEFAPPYTGSPIAMTASDVGKTGLEEPYGIAFDDQKRMYIADYGNNRVVVLKPPYTQKKAEQIITNGISQPIALAFDSSCNLWITNSVGFVSEFPPPYTGGILNVNVASPQSLAFDDKDDLFIGSRGNSSNPNGVVFEYPPPYNGLPIATITNGVDGPFGLAVDVHENLFVSNYFGSNITEYQAPYASPPLNTLGPCGASCDYLYYPALITFGPK
jgi:hypothetical protein